MSEQKLKVWLRKSNKARLHCYPKIGKNTALVISVCNNAYATVGPDTVDQAGLVAERCLNCRKILYPSHMNRTV